MKLTYNLRKYRPLQRMTKMAKPGLTKILADIQEQVSSDDECIAHNKKIKSIRSNGSSTSSINKGRRQSMKSKNGGSHREEQTKTKITVLQEESQKKQPDESIITVIENDSARIEVSPCDNTGSPRGILAEVKNIYSHIKDDTRQLNNRMDMLEGLLGKLIVMHDETSNKTSGTGHYDFPSPSPQMLVPSPKEEPTGHNQVISNSNSMQQLQPDDTRQRTRTRHQAETSPVAEDFDEVFHPERPNTMDGTLTPVSDLTEMSETQLTTRSVTQTETDQESSRAEGEPSKTDSTGTVYENLADLGTPGNVSPIEIDPETGPEPTVPPRHAFKSNETVEGYPRPMKSQNEEVQPEEIDHSEPSKIEDIPDACEEIAPATADQPEEITTEEITEDATEEATEDNISDTEISTSEITNPDPDRENNPSRNENVDPTESALSVAPSVNDTEL